MESKHQFQKTFVPALGLFLTIILSSCMQTQFWQKKGIDLHAQDKKIWFAPVQGEGLAPGSAESLRQLCITEFRNQGYTVNTDSTLPAGYERQIKLQILEFRYKRGLGEEPVAGLHAELIQNSQAIASLQITGDGSSLNLWSTQSLSRLGTQICTSIAQRFLP